MAVSVVDRDSGSSADQASGSVPVRYGRARQALVDATVVLSSRVGFHGLTVADLSVAAGVGPRTFYNHFADLSDVFFEACWQLHEELRVALQAAYDGAVADRLEDIAGTNGDRLVRSRAYACVEALVAFVQADPVRARVLFVESYAGGPAVAGLRAETVGWLIGLVVGEDDSSGDGRHRGAEAGDGPKPTVGPGLGRLSAEFAVGGINGVLCARIKAADLDGLVDLVPSFADALTSVRRTGSSVSDV